jgi:hypothetical protein
VTQPIYTGINDDAENQGSKLGSPMIYNIPVPSSYAAGATLTTGDMLGGIVVMNGTGGVTATLPTAALLVAAIPKCKVGDSVEVLITNGATTSGAITIAAGTGGSFDTNQGSGSQTILFGNSKYITCRVTNTTAGSQAYVIYS